MSTRASLHEKLLNNIKTRMLILKAFYKECCDHWAYEDRVYRFYHHSFKVYRLQDLTLQVANLLADLDPKDKPEINHIFRKIISKGTNKQFKLSHNKHWGKHAQPILEAFFHAKFMLEMAIKYGESLDEPPQVLPSGWATLLYLYNIRYCND